MISEVGEGFKTLSVASQSEFMEAPNAKGYIIRKSRYFPLSKLKVGFILAEQTRIFAASVDRSARGAPISWQNARRNKRGKLEKSDLLTTNAKSCFFSPA